MKKLINFKNIITALVLFSVSGLLTAQTAKVQVIHNSADPAAANVAIWLINGGSPQKAIDSFEFREATPYLDIPAGSPITIAISAAGKTSIADTISGLSTTVTLQNNANYVLMALGNVGTGFSPNPNSKNTGFKLLAVPNARRTAQNQNNVEFFVVHGATDAPAIDIYVRGNAQPLVNDAAFGDATPYFSVPASYYVADLTLSNSTAPLATFELDFEGGEGETVVLFASGFLQPSANKNGERLGLFAALSDGSVEEVLPPLTAVQVIHNSASPASANVDVYASFGLYSDKILDDFKFRTATGFVDLPALTPLKISFAPANSSSIADTLAGLSQTVVLDTNINYLVMAIGNVGMGFAANPDGVSTNFRLLAVPNVRLQSTSSQNINLMVVHGSADAPTVDVVVEANGSKLVNNARFGDATGYATVNPVTYRLLVQDSGNTTTVAAFNAGLNTLAGTAPVVFASGYLNPSANNNGPAFGLFAAVDNVVLPLTNSTSIAEATKTIAASVYPNPVKEALNIDFELASSSVISLQIFDNTGKVVYTQTNSGVAGVNSITIPASQMDNGIYFYTLQTSEGINVNKFVISK